MVVRPRLQVDGRLGGADGTGIDFLCKDNRFRVHRDFLQARNHLRCAALLIPSSQVLRKELLRFHEQGQIVDRPSNTVPFIWSEQVPHREAAAAPRNDLLFSLASAYPWTMTSLSQQQTRLVL